MKEKIIVRFPPSPTGFLHIGNTRIVIINWLFAKKNHGEILLRFDDTDTERVKEEFKTQMLKDFKWLGLEFDKQFAQSERLEIYKTIFQKCLDKGFVYPCFETEEELEMKRKIQLANGKPPIYQKCDFTDEQKKNLPYFRFKLSGEKVMWNDEIQGEISYDVKDLSDPVILRANGNFMYTFCSVVDDFLTGITHIIRGADHITNTAIQIQILNAIAECHGLKREIKFAHLPLFQGKEGKISKRVGGFSIMEMQKAGYEPEAIFNVLAKIGLSYYDDNFKQIGELIDEFEIKNFNKAQIYFDFTLLEHFNKKCLLEKQFADVSCRLKPEISAMFFEKIKENITFLHEVEEWHAIFKTRDLTFQGLLSSEDAGFVAQVGTLLSRMQNCDWNILLFEIKKHFPNRKGKSLFLPIRIVLTGKDFGPEMQFILQEIEKPILLKRLQNA